MGSDAHVIVVGHEDLVDVAVALIDDLERWLQTEVPDHAATLT